MIGKKFNLLTVLSKAESKKGTRWNCVCECGNKTIVLGYRLRSSYTKSCGCLRRKPRSKETKAKIGKANSKQVYFNCDYCGKSSSDNPSSYGKKKRHFCSTDCYSLFRKHMLPFTEQHAYKGVRKEGESKQVYHRRYVKRNPEKIAHLKARRYAREKGTEGSHTLSEWQSLKRKFNYKCAICGEEKPLTKDHIKPLSKGGTDYIENIQPLCRSCNSRKHNFFNIHENPELLEK